MPCMTDHTRTPSPVGSMMLCDGITRESENPGSHALIWYLRSTVHWSGCRGLRAWEGSLHALVERESHARCVDVIRFHPCASASCSVYLQLNAQSVKLPPALPQPCVIFDNHFLGWCFNATFCCLWARWWWALSSQGSAWHPKGSGVDSAVRRPQDSSTTRVAPARGAGSVWISRWTRALTGLSTRTMDGMIGNDGLTVSLTAPVSVMGTSAVTTAAAVVTDGPEPTVTNE